MIDLQLADEREAVASASRHLAEEGLLIGTAGNVSARNGDLIAVTPTGANLATLTAEMITVIDLHGEVIDGHLAPTSEVPLHTAIYAATNALAVTHAHRWLRRRSPVVATSCRLCTTTVSSSGGSTRTAAYATFGTDEFAQNVVEALQGRNAALMQNHGSVTYGSTMNEAVERLELLEWMAELFLRASSLGVPRTLTDSDLEAVIMQGMSGRYGALRKVDEKRLTVSLLCHEWPVTYEAVTDGSDRCGMAFASSWSVVATSILPGRWCAASRREPRMSSSGTLRGSNRRRLPPLRCSDILGSGRPDGGPREPVQHTDELLLLALG